MSKKYCKCCNLGLIDGEKDSHDICYVCGWEDDEVQNDDPDFAGGANTLSLNEYRRKFKEKRKINSNYVWAESKT
jgi:hypothetical protein